MRVKICGITRTQDAKLALELGATEIGFIFAESPRRISLARAISMREELGAEARIIGVFVNESMDQVLGIALAVGLDGVQLHGQETPEEVSYLKRLLPELTVVKTITVKNDVQLLKAEDYPHCDALLYDSGFSHFHPKDRRPLGLKISSAGLFYLAGGVTPSNVLDLIRLHEPHGIDLSSGVESAPGIKDKKKLTQLFETLKESACKR